MRLHKRTIEAVPIIHQRLTRGMYRSFSRNPVFLRGGGRVRTAVSTGVVIEWCSTIVERLLLDGTLQFDGIPADPRHILFVSGSVRRRALETVSARWITIDRTPTVVHSILLLYYAKQHIVSLGPNAQVRRAPLALVISR